MPNRGGRRRWAEVGRLARQRAKPECKEQKSDERARVWEEAAGTGKDVGFVPCRGFKIWRWGVFLVPDGNRSRETTRQLRERWGVLVRKGEESAESSLGDSI